ncbi:MAG TPA: carboxypeptidase regulatory-like domain-containing protein [Gemmatimonadales bacterium]|nr:carboxypeptidase regulatory-like domain-containing protein [Gemmatimonadales bacterium]
MSRLAGLRHFGALLFGAALLVLASAPPAAAQTTTGTIRGVVRDSAGGVLSGADIEARNPATGGVRRTTSGDDGAYVLPGLVPAVYDLTVRHIGSAPSTRRVQVEIGATLLANFTISSQAVEISGVTVNAVAPAFELKTSEVATNISTQQLQQLPTLDRNFLDFAALAPGVTVTEDRVNSVSTRTIAAGGGSPDQVNVFIDGASMKNDLTAGGIAGQDASRGNPFPQSAIQEYRIITQNFKAEYQKASSAIITATTRSGSNQWMGSAFFGYSGKSLIALDTFQIKDKNASPGTFEKPAFSRNLLSLSGGGPLIRDRLFVFGSYEGNYQDRSDQVNIQNIPTGFGSALDSLNFAQYNGFFTSPFRESLVFGKLSYNVSPNSFAELSWNHRGESDVRDFGGTNAFQEAVNFRQIVDIGNLKYNYATGPWLDEALVTFERFQRNPTPDTPGLVARQYQWLGGSAQVGSNLSIQDFIQRRIGFRNDVTYTGFHGMGDHVFKAGASVDLVNYDITKRNNETPLYQFADTINPGCWCRDTAGEAFNFRSPYQLVYGTGIPGVNLNNNEIGAYIQDDWTPTPRLTINLGLRWDYETNMINSGYVTPQEVVDTLTRYNDSLSTPLDLNRYISNGHNRSGFKGAFQPRLGFSYALDKDSKNTLFGGFGIYYDRTIFDFSVDEIQKLTHPTYNVRFADPDSTPAAGQVAWNDSLMTTDTVKLNKLAHTFGLPEAFLIANDNRPPKSTQWSLGIKHVMGSWLATVTYQGQRGTDLFTYNWANVGAIKPDGTCCTPSFNIAAHGFANIIYSTNDGKTWYDALTLQFDHPYQRTSENFGWGGGISYTYARRYIAGSDNIGDLTSSFPGSFPYASSIGKHADNGGNDERQRVVANWIMDMPYLFGVQFSGLLTLSSGATVDIGCPSRFCGPSTYINGGFTPTPKNTFIPGGWAYERMDVRLRKDFPGFSGTRLGVTLDVFNLFNTMNFSCYDTGFNSPTFGQATCLASDPRRVQLGAQYDF